jgi:exodeoxyribonuclease V alpha subunit
MRGGLERWKRGVDSRGVRNAIAYAMDGTCDGHLHGAMAAAEYGEIGDDHVTRFIAENGALRSDELTAGGLRVWLTGHEPATGEERGRQLLSPDSIPVGGTRRDEGSRGIAVPFSMPTPRDGQRRPGRPVG